MEKKRNNYNRARGGGGGTARSGGQGVKGEGRKIRKT